jgi:EAL domain-containing protein (putative c-di-GMP-specific phosphodiesterase class I)
MAFQPIVDVDNHTVFAYEALARGPQGQSALSVLQPGLPFESTPNFRYHLDRALRTRAIEIAATLRIPSTGAKLSINFMPGSVYDPQTCIRSTLKAASDNDFPTDALIFEILEDERIDDIEHLRSIVTEYHRHGFQLALDDFGSAYSGLSLLTQVSADIIKLDASLVRGLHDSPRAQAVLRHTTDMCLSLGAAVIAEAIETPDEYHALRDCGVTLMQGYLFARPAFEAIPPITWPTP